MKRNSNSGMEIRELPAEEEDRLLKNIKFKYRNAKKYIRELTEIDFKLLELKQTRLSRIS